MQTLAGNEFNLFSSDVQFSFRKCSTFGVEIDAPVRNIIWTNKAVHVGKLIMPASYILISVNISYKE